jgi:S1-C subfamily serine protease
MAMFNNASAKSALLSLLLGLLLPVAGLATSPSQALLANESNTIKVFKTAAPYVVFVHRMQRVSNGYMQSYEKKVGSGSGILWDNKGRIVTNFHLVRGVSRVAVTLNNGQISRAKVLGVAPRKDIAVLQLTSKQALQKLRRLKPLILGNSKRLVVGQKVLAIGNPFGFDHSLTTGIISALGRRIPSAAGVSIRDMIQTDASINPGNSGGPLLDSEGHLIGMNTAIYSRTGTSVGIGFAVPVNDLKSTVTQIIRFGRVIQPGLGIERVDDRVAQQLRVRGVIIARVLANTPAARVGLRGTTRLADGRLKLGDVIVGINGNRVRRYDDLYNILSRTKVGDMITLKIIRANKPMDVRLRTIDMSTR